MNTETIIVRVEKSLKYRIEKESSKLGLSLSAYVRMLLKKNVQKTKG